MQEGRQLVLVSDEQQFLLLTHFPVRPSRVIDTESRKVTNDLCKDKWHEVFEYSKELIVTGIGLQMRLSKLLQKHHVSDKQWRERASQASFYCSRDREVVDWREDPDRICSKDCFTRAAATAG